MLAAATLLLAAGCASGTAGRCGKLTPEVEALAGARAARRLESRHGGVVRDPAVEARMERIARLLLPANAASHHVRCRLLNSIDCNAFSLPGCRVYITRGLHRYLQRDDLLAAVIAHELAHVERKDHFKPRCCNDGQSMKRELAADEDAARLLEKAGLPPAALVEVIRLTARQGVPCWSDSRIAALQQLLRGSEREVQQLAFSR